MAFDTTIVYDFNSFGDCVSSGASPLIGSGPAVQAIPFSPSPPGYVLHTIPAHGFPAPPPAIGSAHLIPAECLAAMQPAWCGGAYPATQVRLHCLENVTLAAEGLVFMPGVEVVPASITQHGPDEVAAAMRAIATTPLTTELTGPHVLCVKRGAYNYGHWLAEMLPAALLAERMLGPGMRYLVPPAGGPMGAAIADSLAMAGIGPERIVRLADRPVRARELIMVHGLSLHGLYLSPLVAELLQDLARDVRAADPGCRLFVSRAGQARSLCHERQVTMVLADLGWRIADPGRMAFADQVALFKGCNQVAGVMGAGLANTLFTTECRRADVFAPAGMPDTFFYLIACLRGMQYRETRCFETSVPYGPAPWDSGLLLGLSDVLRTLG